MQVWSRLLCISAWLSAGAVYSKDMSVSTVGGSGQWADISAKVTRSLEDECAKIGYPGKTAGIVVDRITGNVFMVIPDQGIWRSDDQGNSFARIDGGRIGGRCETGSSLNFDPLGKSLTCLMLDGPSGCTLDGGKTWQPMKAKQRGWDSGSVQWSGDKTANIFALRHECGGEIYASDDIGKSWKLKGKAFASVGILDAKNSSPPKKKNLEYFAQQTAAIAG
ncbi:MAG: hypothetical protein JSU70_16960 [Phycisphaerales bacterium]|nr:MAG: hypothetical protein JSU70_16960 [Phycisphaerales bacterium]